MTQSIWVWATDLWAVAFAQGVIVGAGFALLLFLSSRSSRAARPLSYGRLGFVGAIAPAAIGLVVLGPGIGVGGGLILAGLGASTAMLSLAVARRARDAAIVGGVEQSRISAT